MGQRGQQRGTEGARRSEQARDCWRGASVACGCPAGWPAHPAQHIRHAGVGAAAAGGRVGAPPRAAAAPAAPDTGHAAACRRQRLRGRQLPPIAASGADRTDAGCCAAVASAAGAAPALRLPRLGQHAADAAAAGRWAKASASAGEQAQECTGHAAGTKLLHGCTPAQPDSVREGSTQPLPTPYLEPARLAPPPPAAPGVLNGSAATLPSEPARLVAGEVPLLPASPAAAATAGTGTSSTLAARSAASPAAATCVGGGAAQPGTHVAVPARNAGRTQAAFPAGNDCPTPCTSNLRLCCPPGSGTCRGPPGPTLGEGSVASVHSASTRAWYRPPPTRAASADAYTPPAGDGRGGRSGRGWRGKGSAAPPKAAGSHACCARATQRRSGRVPWHGTLRAASGQAVPWPTGWLAPT